MALRTAYVGILRGTLQDCVEVVQRVVDTGDLGALEGGV